MSEKTLNKFDRWKQGRKKLNYVLPTYPSFWPDVIVSTDIYIYIYIFDR